MNTINRFFGMLLILAVLLVGFSWSASVAGESLAETTGSILYVKPDAASGTCADWENACGLQTVLDLAVEGDEIWVAEGVHYPGSESDARTVTFQLESGVALYGGFEGTEEERDERDWVAHPTLLSGDIDRDGTLDGGNAYHVVTGSGVDGTAILDGFTITGGKADGSDYPLIAGGGMYNEAGSPTLFNVTFSGNWGVLGGGMYNESSSPMLTDVTFSSNEAHGEAGGMYNSRSDPKLTRVVFIANHAIYGGGMCNDTSNPTLTDVTFSNNSASQVGGGMYNGDSSPTLTNVTFSGNSANAAGGMYNSSSDPKLTRVVFIANHAINGGGMRNDTSNPTLTDVTFSNNSADGSGGGMYNGGSSPTLTNVTFSGNSADGDGGGMFNYVFSSPTLTNVTFYDNSAESGWGGGIINHTFSSMTLTNAILWGNTPDQIFNLDIESTATVSNSDIQGDCPPLATCTEVINFVPLFVDPDNGNLRLQHTSPAIDAGDNDAVPVGLTTDLDGSPRKVDIDDVVDTGNGTSPIVDMGAYEAQAGAEIIYVDRDAPGPVHDGQSWGSAFTGLQSGLAAAQDGNEVWVAEGTYYPGVVGSRNATFQLKSGVELYGGFEGTEAERELRNWDDHPALLSGDIDRDGSLENGNAYHVVTGSGVDGTAILDGFTITGGKADGDLLLDQDRGGGMLNDSSSPMLNNVTFSGNLAVEGGGMHNSDSSPTLTDVTFSNNEAHGIAGGMHNLSSDPILTRVVFTANHAIFGGGMYNDTSNPTLTDIIFSNNSASMAGGGIYNGSSSPTLTNVTFSGNSVDGSGGGMFNLAGSPTLTNVTFSGNSANIGGAMYNNLSSSPLLTNNIVWGNSPTADQIYNNIGTATVSYSDIEGGYTGTGNIDDDPLFVDPDNGDLHLQHGSPAIDAGDNAAVPVEVTTDLDGNPRFVDIPGILDTGVGDPPIVDMGAYEVQPYFYWVYLPMIWK